MKCCFFSILLTFIGARKDEGSNQLGLIFGCLSAAIFLVVVVCVVAYNRKRQTQKKPHDKTEPLSLNVSKNYLCLFL